jgi:hypothetical protein
MNGGTNPQPENDGRPVVGLPLVLVSLFGVAVLVAAVRGVAAWLGW